MLLIECKYLLQSVAIALLLQGSIVHALPMLSADGSVLTDLDVNGVSYDVMFGNSISSETWGDVVFDADRMSEADAVSQALFDFFIVPENAPGQGQINGCANAYFGCLLFLPDHVEDVHDHISDEYLYTWFVDDQSIEVYSRDPYARLRGNFGSSPWTDSREITSVTHVTYVRRDAEIPLPSSFALILLAGGVAMYLQSLRRKAA